MPAKADRVLDKNALVEILESLNELFADAKKKPQKPEVLGWDKDKGYTPAKADGYIQQVRANLEKAGYKTELRDVGEQNGITIKFISANKAA